MAEERRATVDLVWDCWSVDNAPDSATTLGLAVAEYLQRGVPAAADQRQVLAVLDRGTGTGSRPSAGRPSR